MVKHGASVVTKYQENRRGESQQLQSLFMKGRRRPIRGFITSIKKAEGDNYYYLVQVRADSAGNNTEKISGPDIWLPLAEDPAVIALLYGNKDLIVNKRCRVEYDDATPRSGIVFIEFDPKRSNKPRKGATEFDQKAFLYAAAGGGKII